LIFVANAGMCQCFEWNESDLRGYVKKLPGAVIAGSVMETKGRPSKSIRVVDVTLCVSTCRNHSFSTLRLVFLLFGNAGQWFDLR
jgi:hypothetical protein